MPRVLQSRRELLERCAAFGVLTVASPLTLSFAAAAWEESDKRPTPWCELGPFYKKRAPEGAMLRSEHDTGLPLAVSGSVLDVRGEALPNATLEVWHADHFGHYDNEGYRYRRTVRPDSQGAYSFESVMPGHYPDRVCQHVHYLVTAPGHKPLITQLYFATDPVFEGDPDRNFHRDPLITSRELVRPVLLAGDPKLMHAAVNFKIVLEKL